MKSLAAKWCAASLAVLTVGLGCARFEEARFKKQIQTVIRAGQDKLTPEEKDRLTRENDPVLLQVADPNTQKLIALFANLPAHSQEELLKTGYLKWDFSSLDAGRQQLWREFVQVNLDLAAKKGGQTLPTFSQAALEKAQVGFAVVTIPDLKAKVVSWYILWPEGSPTWVTVVGARVAGSQPYFNAHLLQLPLLKDKAASRLPD